MTARDEHPMQPMWPTMKLETLYTDYGGQVRVPVCDECGGIVHDMSKHRTACPRIKPDLPLPVPENLGALLLRHRAQGCRICQFPANNVIWADHLHTIVSDIVYQAAYGS